jgi:hypothetical protein
MCVTGSSASAPASRRDCSSPSAFNGFSNVNTLLRKTVYPAVLERLQSATLISEDNEGKDILLGLTMPHNKNLASQKPSKKQAYSHRWLSQDSEKRRLPAAMTQVRPDIKGCEARR